MSTVNRRAFFDEAQEKRKEEEKRKKEGNSFLYSNYYQVAIPSIGNGQALIRLYGTPVEVRREGSDPKKIYTMKIVDDSGKQKTFYIDNENYGNHLLKRIYYEITKKTFNKETQKKEIFYERRIPDIYDMVTKNSRTDSKYEAGWKPSARILFNCFDYQDIDFHLKNKHSKILSSKVNTVEKKDNSGETISYYEVGIPAGTYEVIWNHVAQYDKYWEDYLIIFEKIEKTPNYQCMHYLKDSHKITDINIKKILKTVDFNVLGDIYKNYEYYDFNKIYKQTSYKTIYESLKSKIKSISEAVGINYIEELERLVQEERKNVKKEVSETAFKIADEVSGEIDEYEIIEETSIVEDQEPNFETKKRGANSAVSGKKNEIFDTDTLDKSLYKGISSLSKEELQCICGVTQTGKFLYNTLDLYECVDKKCKFSSPASFKHCPKCGIELPAPE